MIELFSEKVEPTFTSSNHNIITVESYEEVFFDVFEFEINGTKYIAEKQTTYKGSPVVSIPVVEKGVRKEMPFILIEGDRFDVAYNQRNNKFVDIFNEAATPVADIYIEDDVVDIVEDYKKEALAELREAKINASKYAEEIKQQKIYEAQAKIIEERKEAREFFSNVKGDLIDEFNSIVIDTRCDLENYTKTTLIEAQSDLKVYAEEKWLDLKESLKYTVDGIFESSNEKISSIREDFNAFETRIDEQVTDIRGTFEEKIKSKFDRIEGLFENQITNQISKEHAAFEEKIDKQLDEVHDTFVQESIKLNDSFKRGVDKALSRTGNIKSSLNKRITSLEEKAAEEIENIASQVATFYDNSLQANKDLDESIRSLIEESKVNILEQIQKDVEPLKARLITENYNPIEGTKEFDNSVEKLKQDLEKSVNEKFTLEVSSLKRLIELSSGGGSVAVQYVNGGTMNGDLIVNGCITARCINIHNPDFEDYALDSIFRDVVLAVPVDQNITQTFNIRTCPRLAMAKFHAVYTGCDAIHNRTFVELFIGIEDENCFVNGYSVINTDENNPVLENITCSISGGYLNIISDVSVDSSIVLTGRGTYLVTPPYGVAGCGESCSIFDQLSLNP